MFTACPGIDGESIWCCLFFESLRVTELSAGSINNGIGDTVMQVQRAQKSEAIGGERKNALLLTGISPEAFNQLFMFLTKYLGISP